MRRGESMTEIFTYILIAAFAAMCLMVVALGARVYGTVTDNAGKNSDMRTSVNYIASKVRANDREGAVSAIETGGMSVLMLKNMLGGEEYATYIYCCDGELREYLARADAEFDAELGECIASASAFYCEGLEGALLITLMQEGVPYTLHLALKGGTA